MRNWIDMYRLLFTAIWSVLVGAITLAGIAWIPPFLGKSADTITAGRVSLDGRLWQVTMTHGAMLDHVRLESARGLMFGGPAAFLHESTFEAIPVNLPSAEESPYLRSFEVICTGWPWRAFRTSRSFDITTIDPLAEVWTHGAVLDDGMLAMTDPLAARVLPYGPVWGGLFADLTVWAGAWFGLFVSIGVLRAALRRARGRCARCGYDLAGASSDRCPECGAALRHRAA